MNTFSPLSFMDVLASALGANVLLMLILSAMLADSHNPDKVPLQNECRLVLYSHDPLFPIEFELIGIKTLAERKTQNLHVFKYSGFVDALNIRASFTGINGLAAALSQLRDDRFREVVLTVPLEGDRFSNTMRELLEGKAGPSNVAITDVDELRQQFDEWRANRQRVTQSDDRFSVEAHRIRQMERIIEQFANGADTPSIRIAYELIGRKGKRAYGQSGTLMMTKPSETLEIGNIGVE